ncbi:alkylmercury lyase family protein [Cellulomonas hominis]|uniref:alkylmercury lyase family protein n=1 Tax=Cellulomonas hominis TaxID=156981 RepID=UPI001C105452|nr:alkylmercury lyase family protein [Cellulomonas hominis]MBU5421173.1 alkylmercury lyase family protein [Cellulomonas hominis]
MTTTTARTVRDLVYGTFAQEGRAPSAAEIARKAGLDLDEGRRLLRELADAHALVLNADGDAVRMAHPFSAAPMAFVVTPIDGHDDRRWWGGCAWDSFGISAALHLDVRVDTACPECGAPISLSTGPSQPPPAELAVRFPAPAAHWWDDVVGTCTSIRMFCGPGHAERWTDRHAPGTGYVADARTVWSLATPWYGDRLDAQFEPHTREHNQALLDACGLTGAFWQLP